VKGSFFIFDWIGLASVPLCLFGGFGRGILIHITAIPGLLVFVRFPFATRPLSPAALEASFLIRLEVVDKLAVPVGVVALSRSVTMGETWHIAVFVVRHGADGAKAGVAELRSWPLLVPHPLPRWLLWPLSAKVVATISGACCSSGGFFRLLLLFCFPVFWMAEAFRDSRASSSTAA
jgi:hypothetical protein